MPRRRSFRIGNFVIEPERNLVTGPDGAATVEPKIMDVLCVLAERPGRVFSRAELIDRVWGTEFGADESLTRAISQLRKAFGDTRNEAHAIETISKRGYRLIAPILEAQISQDDRPEGIPAEAAGNALQAHRILSWMTRRRRLWAVFGTGTILALFAAYRMFAPSPPEPPSVKPAAAFQQSQPDNIAVAVMPFENVAHDAGTSAIAQTLAENLIAALSHGSLVRVSAGDSRSSVQVSRRDGTAGLRFAIQGSVQKSGTRLRVNVQIVDPARGDHLWTQTYERSYNGSLSEGDRLSSDIAAELYPPLLLAAKAELMRRPILSLVPWELNLIATWVPGGNEVFLAPHGKDGDWPQRRALAIDPKYAPAHATLAEYRSYHALFDPPSDTEATWADSDHHGTLAIDFAPFDADVLFHVATYYRFAGEREKALGMLRRVLVLQPSSLVARIDLPFVEGKCGRNQDDAILQLRALGSELSSRNPARWVVLSHLADLYLARGAFEQAREAAEQSRQIVRTTWTNITLAAALAELGRPKEAARIVAEARQEWPNLDFTYFATHTVPRWCLGGPRTNQVRGIFLHLATSEKSK